MSSTPKVAVYEQLARISKALSNPIRLEILELLAQSERSVDVLASMTGQSIANVSQHLQQLRQAGLVTSRKQGLFVFYRLAGDEVVDLLGALGRVGETYLADLNRVVQTYFSSEDALEAMPARDVLERARKGLITVIDVRPADEYEAGHLPGAISIPLPELQKRLRELPKRKEIVAYCRGPYCLMSFAAVKTLRSQGFKARRLQAGLPEWRSAGLPVESSERPR
jgi:rhodanese-related sulfurtransferase/DNA-binding transcriptional ArsR family regulator